MLVYVLNQDGSPLMPCQPVIARLVLKAGKAHVKYRTPFTIKLNYQLERPYIQELKTGIDPGSGTFGVAVTNEREEVLYLSQVQVRNDIKKKMTQRRNYRRTRRHRKCRYRPKRFDNRTASKRKGRLSPTLTSKLQAHVRELRFIARMLPISLDNLTIEGGTFDSHAIKNPEVLTNNWLYQKGEMYGYEHTKSYVRARDHHTCQLCKGKSKLRRLECHHIVPRGEGGTDAPTNLITLCEECHNQIHKGEKKLSNRAIQASITRNVHATQMNILRSQLMRVFSQAVETLGCITKIDRETLGFPKTHYLDAAVIASRGKPVIFKQSYVLFKMCVPDGDYQQRKGRRSERPVPRAKINGFKKFDQVHYQGRAYFLKGRMSTGYAILMDIHGAKHDLGHTPKMNCMIRVSARKTCLITSEPLLIEQSIPFWRKLFQCY